MKVQKLFENETLLGLHKDLQILLKDIRSKYKDIDFRPNAVSRNRIFINFIGSKNFGDAAKALLQLCDWADKKGIELMLSASDDFGTNKNKLIKDYKRFGFELEFDSESLMKREPK